MQKQMRMLKVGDLVRFLAEDLDYIGLLVVIENETATMPIASATSLNRTWPVTLRGKNDCRWSCVLISEVKEHLETLTFTK